jgi:hypothetical protein
MNPKRKSQKRFEQANELVDRIAPTLPSPAYVAVVFVAWRHAHGRTFSVSVPRLAKGSCCSIRHVRTMLDNMEFAGVIRLVKEKRGTIPRTYQFTGNEFNKSARGELIAPLDKS